VFQYPPRVTPLTLAHPPSPFPPSPSPTVLTQSSPASPCSTSPVRPFHFVSFFTGVIGLFQAPSQQDLNGLFPKMAFKALFLFSSPFSFFFFLFFYFFLSFFETFTLCIFVNRYLYFRFIFFLDFSLTFDLFSPIPGPAFLCQRLCYSPGRTWAVSA
jgi:hypothetical protein